MTIKGYLWVPVGSDQESIMSCLLSADEQSGYYSTKAEAESVSRRYENLRDKWEIVPITIVVGSAQD